MKTFPACNASSRGANDFSSFLRAVVEPTMARQPSRGPAPLVSARQSVHVAPAGGVASVMKYVCTSARTQAL
jgi:hypothetical protein